MIDLLRTDPPLRDVFVKDDNHGEEELHERTPGFSVVIVDHPPPIFFYAFSFLFNQPSGFELSRIVERREAFTFGSSQIPFA